MKFAASASLLLALAVAFVAADITTVKNDVAAIDAAVTDLNNQLGGSINYFSALAIHNSAQSLDAKVKQATTDTNALTPYVSDADATDVLNTLTGTEVNIKSASNRLVAIKSQLTSLGVAGLAKSDINALATDTHTFGQALIAKVDPASAVAPKAQTLATTIDNDLAVAVAAYA